MTRFEGVLTEAPGGGAFVEVPPTVIEALGGGGRIKVVVDFDGQPYRGSVVSMGGQMVLGVLKDIRAANGWEFGESIRVALERDTRERTVDVPAELAAALAENKAARENYDGMSYTGRREYAQWIASAKRDDTKTRRAAKAVEMLERGEKL